MDSAIVFLMVSALLLMLFSGARYFDTLSRIVELLERNENHDIGIRDDAKPLTAISLMSDEKFNSIIFDSSFSYAPLVVLEALKAAGRYYRRMIYSFLVFAFSFIVMAFLSS